MTAKEFRVIGLYALNRVDYCKFGVLLGKEQSPYLEDKFSEFRVDVMSFLLNNHNFLEKMIKKMEWEGYKG